ncbi:oxidoreductase [Streptomyces xiaopingdaonensis]|uniref:oxidoreductase n=1 Tax=Streptomyces xiaopingdaonensis TaxID=1565415 RepID=UPI0006823EEF|nr:oxidoreductase [Streptomyces xiaopingdaonensis]
MTPQHTGTPDPAQAAGVWQLGGDTPVSRMGFGAMRLPVKDLRGPQRDPRDGIAVLRRARELGVNHIDTAAFYFQGEVRANLLIKEALAPYPEGLVLATKVGPSRSPDGAFLPEATPEQLRGQVEQNLTELGVDRLDLVNLRVGTALDRDEAPLGARFEALAALQEEGLIKHLGVSNVTGPQLAEARRIAPVTSVQNRYGISDRGDEELLRQCTEAGIAYVPFFPLGGKDGAQAARIARVAERHEVSPAQLALAWLLSTSPAVLAIPGTGSLTHLEENVAATGVRLTEEELAEVAGD